MDRQEEENLENLLFSKVWRKHNLDFETNSVVFVEDQVLNWSYWAKHRYVIYGSLYLSVRLDGQKNHF